MTACGQADPYTGPDGPVTTEGLTLSWSSDGEWILFPSSSGGSPPELYALNVADTLDGAGREEWLHLSQGFTDVIEPADPNAGTYMHLAWSLDGQRIAFTAGEAVYSFDGACLQDPSNCVDSLRQVIGGASAWLTLAWSPDGSLLLVESTIIGPLVKTEKGILANNLVRVMRVVAADGSGEVILEQQTEPRQSPDWVDYSPFSPAWSPDGEWILYSSGKAGDSDLFMTSLDGQEVVRLTHTPGVEEYSPSWSPDGREILYAVNADGQNSVGQPDIYRQEVDGGALTCVTCAVRPSWRHYLLWPKWSPDGRHVAYAVSGKPGLFRRALPISLYSIAPDGTDQVPVVEKGFPGPPFWSPDGTHLAFAFRPRSPLLSMESDIFLVQADGRGLTRLTD